MPKRRRRRAPKKSEEIPPQVESGASSVRPSRLARLSILGFSVAVLGIAAGWWYLSGVRKNADREAIASLRPMASLVPPGQSRRKEAVELADDLLRNYPERAESLYARGILLSRYGFSEEAVKSWEACLVLIPDLAAAYEQLGIVAFQSGENAKAAELLSEAISTDATSYTTGLFLGKALNRLGRSEEAVSVLTRIQDTEQPSAEAAFELGQSYLDLDQFEQARQWYQAALTADPDFLQAYYGLTRASRGLGQLDAAQAYQAQYVALIDQASTVERSRVRQGGNEMGVDRMLAEAYVIAGKVYLSQGNSNKARQCWARARTVDATIELPDFAHIED